MKTKSQLNRMLDRINELLMEEWDADTTERLDMARLTLCWALDEEAGPELDAELTSLELVVDMDR